jgi:hypothetical protein
LSHIHDENGRGGRSGYWKQGSSQTIVSAGSMWRKGAEGAMAESKIDVEQRAGQPSGWLETFTLQFDFDGEGELP